MDDQNKISFWDWLYALPTPEIIFLAVFLLGSIIVLSCIFSGISIGPIRINSVKGRWRIFGLFVGLILMVPASYSAYRPYINTKTDTNQETQREESSAENNLKTMNGEICTINDDCVSGACYPAPHPQKNGANTSICLAADMNCALQGTDGALYGAILSINGTRLTCKNPGSGTAQFMR